MMIYLFTRHVSRWRTIKLLLCVSLWLNISGVSLFGTTAFSLGTPSAVSYRSAAETRHLGYPAARSLSNPAKVSLSASSDSLSLEQKVLLCGLKKLHRRRMNPIASDTKRSSWVERQASIIPGAGYGLVARKNIPAGTIVAYYPAHRLGVEYDTEEDEDGSVLISMTVDQEDQDYFEKQAVGGAPSSNYLHFLMGKRPLYHPDKTTVQAFERGALFVDVNPNQPLVPGWMGHLVNDGATVASTAEQSILEYYAASRAAKNCVHIPFGPSPMLVTITTQKVKKGQELFTTYGCNYWIDALLGPAEMDTVEITPAIQDEVKETARDIFLALQGANTRRQSEAADLQASFDTPREG